MGNKMMCMSKKGGRSGSKSKRGSSMMSKRKSCSMEEALAMVAIHHHQPSQRFDSNGSMSRRIGSTSSRRRPTTDFSDPLSNKNDVALAMVSMRPIALGPMMEKLCLSAQKYGKGRRFYIQTLDDNALSADVQERLVRENPPQGVFMIKGSDHCPFFSKPHSLHKILIQIALIP